MWKTQSRENTMGLSPTNQSTMQNISFNLKTQPNQIYVPLVSNLQMFGCAPYTDRVHDLHFDRWLSVESSTHPESSDNWT